jgi:ABC-2 type transport system permease protein
MMALAWHQFRLERRMFWRNPTAAFFNFLLPLLLLALFGAVFAGRREDLDVIVPGIAGVSVMSATFIALAYNLTFLRESGVLKRLRGTPMPKWVYFAGKVILVLTVGLAEVILLLAVAFLFYDLPVPPADHWLTFAWVSVLGITACTLCGIAFSSVARTGRSAPAVVTPVALILQFISGVFFVFTDLPVWMQQVASVFPLKWMCQGMRAVFLPESFAAQEPAGSWELGRVALVLAAWCLLGLVLCVTTFRWTTRRDG